MKSEFRLRFWCSNGDFWLFSVKISPKTSKFRPKIVFLQPSRADVATVRVTKTTEAVVKRLALSVTCLFFLKKNMKNDKFMTKSINFCTKIMKTRRATNVIFYCCYLTGRRPRPHHNCSRPHRCLSKKKKIKNVVFWWKQKSTKNYAIFIIWASKNISCNKILIS